MDVLEILKNRKSVREYSKYKVTDEEVGKILEAVQRTPSGKNTQPWRLRLVQGEKLEKLRQVLCNAFDCGVEPAPELNTTLLQAYRSRAVALGKSLFTYKGIAREDTEARRKHDRLNFEFFGAPQVFALGIDKNAYHEGTLIDCGIFLGYLLTAIEGAGFGSCPQMSPLMYAKEIRKVLPEEDTRFLCFIPFGKPLENSYVNQFVTEREPLESWFIKYSE
ncbi:MAG: nitroreductase [Fibrobacteraceae bacterium]|nr:nitroreductase [Fibrobacteraceae bacterium]